MKHLLFAEKWDENYPCNTYVANVSSISTQEELFLKFSKALRFPSYFGKNWDALDELLRDFWWIENKNIVILHHDLSGLSLNELRIYIGIVLNSVDFWNHYLNDPHHLLYIFPLKEEDKILKIINEQIQASSFEFQLKMEDL